MVRPVRNAVLYRTIWRWHFYAGLFIVPVMLILATTGATYLFKPQIERWEERAFQGLPTTRAATPSAQRDAALAAFPGSRFVHYRLPERTGDAALIQLELPNGKSAREVFVSPQGEVVGALDPDRRIMEITKRIHGQLLLGYRGSWLVELAASWAIVLIVTGLYLWWPRNARLAGVIWPRLARGRRVLLRDVHAVTGFWVAGLAMVLLLTGLPWAHVWGSGFKAIREEMGWTKGEQDWTIGGRPAGGGEHGAHVNAISAMHGQKTRDLDLPGRHELSLDGFVARASAERLAFPVIVTPPTHVASPWMIRSDSQNRPLRVTVKYDPRNGRELLRETFADKHVIDRAVGYGIAWHEGQLFGVTNQIVGALTAFAILTIAVTGFIGWWQRKPEGRLGAPPKSSLRPETGGIKFIIALCFVLLPMFALSVVVLWIFDRIALPRLPSLAAWMGIREASHVDNT